MSNTAQKLMTDEEFFAFCQQQDEERYELVDGILVKMMTGASNFHDAIVINIIRELSNQLRGKPCRPLTADTAARTRIRNFRRPDVTVMCGPLRPKNLRGSRSPALRRSAVSVERRCHLAEEDRGIPAAAGSALYPAGGQRADRSDPADAD